MIQHLTYLAIILIPGLPAIGLTWFFCRKTLLPKLKMIGLIVAFLVLYLGLADYIAIHGLHIWSFRAESVTGLRIAGDYIEEWVLFIVTQTLLVSWAFILKSRTRDI
jgi:lycopene cyclase domain-containing protein